MVRREGIRVKYVFQPLFPELNSWVIVTPVRKSETANFFQVWP